MSDFSSNPGAANKDNWDKADIISKALIGLFAAIGAILITVIGGNIQQTVSTQTGKIQEAIAIENTGKDYLVNRTRHP